MSYSINSVITPDMCTEHTGPGDLRTSFWFEGHMVWANGSETVGQIRNSFYLSPWGTWWNEVSRRAKESGLDMPQRHINNLRNPDATPLGLLKFFAAQGKDFSFMAETIPPDRDYHTQEKWHLNRVHWCCEVSMFAGKTCIGVLFPGTMSYESLQNLKRAMKKFFSQKYSEEQNAISLYALWESIDAPNRLRLQKRLQRLEKQSQIKYRKKMLHDLRLDYEERRKGSITALVNGKKVVRHYLDLIRKANEHKNVTLASMLRIKLADARKVVAQAKYELLVLRVEYRHKRMRIAE